MFCPNCGSQNPDGANNCSNCGASLNANSQQQNVVKDGEQPKHRLVAGLLGIFLGGLGIHNFYIGFTTKGVIQIIVTFITCGIGGIWGFIEGILILCGSINADAKGRPFTD